MRHHATKQPRRLGGRAVPVLFALAVAALPGCRDQSPTGPEEPAVQAFQTDPPAADLTADQSVASSAEAGSLGVTATRLPKSFFVNPGSGKDTNAGTKLQPFKTLARGLSTAITGDTMRLAIGVYSATSNGEKFTTGTQQVVVPAGVTILGTLGENFTTSQLHGAPGDLIGLNLQGTATVKNLIVKGFTRGIRAIQGVQTLKNLNLDQNVFGLDLSGSAKATLAASTVVLTPISGATVFGATVAQQAQFIMDGGKITSGGQNCQREVTGVALDNAARLTLKNVATLENIAGTALEMTGTSKATLTGFASIDRRFSFLAGGCTPRSSVRTFESASLTLRHASVFSSGGTVSVGIESSSSAPLTLDTASVIGHSGAGVVAKGDFKLVAKAANFRQNTTGLDAIGAPNASITITGSTVSLNNIGIRAPFFKLRNSVVTGNQTGIVLSSPFTDLGQTTDPGNNTISGNVFSGVRFDETVIAGKVGGIFASGNTWNSSTQDSDDSGHYPAKPLLNGLSPFASGKNFVLPTSFNFQIQL
jgi:Protein of unknown function (DUF1565)